MNGATGKTISGLTISNLGLNVNTTLSGSPTITGTLTLTAGALTMTGQTLTMGASGTLNRVAGTLGSAPVYGTGTSVTYSGSGATSANELTPSAGNIGTLTIGGSGTYTLATSLNPTIATLALTSGTLADAGNTITLTGNITGTGTHSGSGKISMTGSGATISAVTTLGNLEIAPGPNNTITASGNVPISGTLTLTSGTIADGGNTITVSGSVFGSGKHTGSGKISMNGSARNIGSVTLQNLELNNAGGFTCTGNPIINGTLTLTAGTLSVATRTLTLNGPAIAGTATNLSTTSSSILSFGGTSSTLSIPSSVVALSSLILNNSNATLTANSAITISGVLALTSGILADGGNILYVGSNITGTGTHTGAGEISMTGSGATISGVTVQNIELNNSGGFSLSGSPTVNGTLTLTTGTLTVGANTLNLNGAAIAGTATNLTTTSSSNLSFGGTNAGPLAIPSSITALNNLTLNNTNGTPATLNANSGITLSGSLALTSGTFADGGNTISVTGNITGTGRHTGAGKISMTGSGKTISGAILQNIEIVPGTGNSISLSGAPTINGVLTLTSGTLTTGANNLSLGGSASATIAPNAKLNASGGTTNFNTRPVTVQSTSAGDGSILPAGGTFSGATNVTLQRYHAQNQRAWRLLSNPLNQSISWATLAGSSTTPFDLTGTGSNASGETYDPASNAFVGYSSTSDAIAATSAYTVFIRGISGQGINADRTYSSSGAPSNVTIGVSGTLNTASVNMIVTAGNYYLIPNPFAAPISVYSFMHSGSNGSYINTSAIYYWDASLGSSDVKVIAGGYGNPSLISAAAPGDANDYIIPMMGAFFVYASGSGTITIPTSAVYTGSFTNKLPYGTGTQNNHIGLTVLRDTKAYDYLNIYLNDQAKASSTDKLDFEKMNNTNLSFYSISSDNKNLSIDERALTTEAIPLGIKTNIQSQFTIKVDGLNTPAGTEIFLTDNLLGTSTALSEGTTYSFTVTADSLTQGNKRFELSYKAKTAIAAPIDNTSNTGVSVYPNPANDYVMINTSTAADINIYDSKGVLMRTEKSAAGNTVKIRTGNWRGGMYVLHINDGQKTVIKKIIIH